MKTSDATGKPTPSRKLTKKKAAKKAGKKTTKKAAAKKPAAKKPLIKPTDEQVAKNAKKLVEAMKRLERLERDKKMNVDKWNSKIADQKALIIKLRDATESGQKGLF